VRTKTLTLTAFLTALCLLPGCGGSSSHATPPANTEVNPGPNSTSKDPGPNNTANGPETLQGTLVARAGCFELDGNAANQPAARFELEFVAETAKRHGSTIVLSGSDGTRTVGAHDTVFVTGNLGSGSGTCGHVFEVQKVVAVTPG
jgi:hypothetical protein